MKPRTKLQVQVLEQSRCLPDIDSYMLAWAKTDCLEHKGFATKSRVVCMDCGQRFSPDIVRRKLAVCPHCGAKLKVEQSRCTTDKQSRYVAIAEIHGEFQVIQNFEIRAYYKAGAVPKYFINEVLQHWIRQDGKNTVVALNHTVNWYCDSWGGDMEIRVEHRRGYYSSGVRYDIYPSRLHPDSEFRPDIGRYGIDHRLQGLTPLEAINMIPDNPKMETLLKARRYELLGYASNEKYKIERYWPSIKICLRNKYRIKDVKIWFDYLDLLRYFHKDLHNAHYVCPDNLKKEHDKLVIKKRQLQEKEEAERKRKRAIEDEAKFKALKAKFLGLRFTDGFIEVRVLESVREVMEEGDALHHCVFTNNYYLKPESLILSARIGDKRIETIEVDLKTLNVVQSRGACNQNTEYHDRIIGLVEKNTRLIKQKLAS